MLKSLTNIALLVSILLNASCASILSGTSDTIYVRSDVPDTKLYLDKTEIGVNEGSIKVNKKRIKKAKLKAVKDGCETVVTSIETQFDSTTLWGLLLDLGLVSILIVDWGIYGSVREAKKLNYVLNPVCPPPT